MKKKHLIGLIIVWTIFLTGSFCWNYHIIESNDNKLVLHKAQSFFEQIKISRAWNAEHGGIYVPISEKTQPNPHLVDSLRDVETLNGIKLTKLNPAFMTRQISEMNQDKNGVQFHITSLKPLRPENKADEWESNALHLFEKGLPEHYEMIESKKANYYRYMAPLKTEQSCLKCHAHQGYKLGDVRGGISVSFPAEEFVESAREQLASLGLVHIIIFFIGIFGLLFFNRLNRKYLFMIEAKTDELSRMNATKDRFFSIIAHDLKSPFNSIIGYSNLLKEEYDSISDEERKEYIGRINKSADSSLNLLENLLLWSASQQDSIKVIKLPLKLKLVVEEAIEPYLSAASLKDIRVNNHISVDYFANVDSFSIKTVIANLFNNAIKYTPIGGEIIIDAYDKEQRSIISVKDNGVGIPSTTIPELFKIESDISTPGTQNEKGTGLGLVLCKDLVEKNDGIIEINSEVGKGTEITIKLPNS